MSWKERRVCSRLFWKGCSMKWMDYRNVLLRDTWMRIDVILGKCSILDSEARLEWKDACTLLIIIRIRRRLSSQTHLSLPFSPATLPNTAHAITPPFLTLPHSLGWKETRSVKELALYTTQHITNRVYEGEEHFSPKPNTPPSSPQPLQTIYHIT